MQKDSGEINHPKKTPNPETYVHQDPHSPPLRIAIESIPESPKPVDEKKTLSSPETIKKNLKLILQVVAAGTALGLLVVNILLWCSNKSTLEEIQKQTTLMRQQAVGSQSAVLVLQEPNIISDPITHRDAVSLGLLNQGHVIASNTHITFEIDQMTFPKLVPVSPPQSYTFVVPQLIPAVPWSNRYPISTFSRQERQFPTQKSTFTIKGTFTFNNGFGDSFTQDFCYSYIGMYNTSNPDDGNTSGGGGFFPCDKFKDLVSYVARWRTK